MRVPALVLSVLLLVGACDSAPQAGMTVGGAGPGVITPADPGFIIGTDFGRDDRLAAAVLLDLRGFWSERFHTVFGKAWPGLPNAYSVNSDAPARQATPCAGYSDALAGNAFYCAEADAIAWDRAALLPALREKFGEAAIVLVLAHEYGHAVQEHAGLRPDSVLVSEVMADCFAGTLLGEALAGRTAHLRLRPAQLDHALAALTVFRDPVGSGRAPEHGSAFDRITAVLTGVDRGPAACAGMTSAGLVTEDLADRENRPTLSVERMIDAAAADSADFLRTVAPAGWRPPAVRKAGGRPCGDAAVIYCAGNDTVTVDTGEELSTRHRVIGDFATAVAVGRAEATATHAGDDLCLTGAWLGRRLAGPGPTLRLGPGDLDEAVIQVLRSAGAQGVRTLATGVTRGATACRTQ
ncbi:hypothetical protein D5S17_29810 [Pseudonocardiaceae bacterium YIM PH 21723]|nr:hypothetical protein D5S17_29810 [Pseudonocardiaceae bacterium YIM PH 21723]